MTELKKTAIIENEIEAQLVESILRERGIPIRLQSYHDAAYDGIFQTQKGWGVIYAPGQNKEEILEILADLRK
jgi:hypothetical protein